MDPDCDISFSLIGSMSNAAPNPEFLKLKQQNAKLRLENITLSSALKVLSPQLSLLLSQLTARQAQILQLQTALVLQHAQHVKTLRGKEQEIRRMARGIEAHAEEMNFLNLKIQRQSQIIEEQSDMRKSFGEMIAKGEQETVNESVQELNTTQGMIRDGIVKMSQNILRLGIIVKALQAQLENDRIKFLAILLERQIKIQQLEGKIEELRIREEERDREDIKPKKKGIKMMSELRDAVRMEYEYGLLEIQKDGLLAEKEKIDSRVAQVVQEIGNNVVMRIMITPVE